MLANLEISQRCLLCLATIAQRVDATQTTHATVDTVVLFGDVVRTAAFGECDRIKAQRQPFVVDVFLCRVHDARSPVLMGTYSNICLDL